MKNKIKILTSAGLDMEEKEEWEPGKMLPPPLPRSTPGSNFQLKRNSEFHKLVILNMIENASN